MTRKFSIDQLRRYKRFWGEGESRTITCSMQDNEQEVADENLHAEEEAHGYGCREAADCGSDRRHAEDRRLQREDKRNSLDARFRGCSTGSHVR